MSEPLALYALNRAGKQRSTFVSRTITAALTMPSATLSSIMVIFGARQNYVALMDLGEIMVAIVILVHLVVMFAVIPIFASTQFATEKREKTLDILLLATPSVFDMYVYKFVCTMVHPLSHIAVTVPIAMIGGFFGGVDYGGLIAYYLAILVASCAIGAAGLLGSILASTPAAAVAVTYVILGGITIPGFLISYFVAPSFPSAAWNLYELLDYTYARSPLAPIIGYYLLCAMVLIGSTLVIIPYYARNQRGGGKARRVSRSHRWSPSLEERFFLSGPRPRWGYGGQTAAVVIFATAFIPIAMVPGPGTIIVTLAVIYDVIIRYDGARSAGEIEEIVLTPMADTDLTRSFYRSNVRASVVYLPAFMAGAVSFPLFWGGGASATSFLEILPATTTIGQWALMVCALIAALAFGVAKYVLAVTVAVRIAMVDLPIATRCCVGVAVYLGLLAATLAMSGLLPFAYALFDQVATGGMPSPSVVIIHALLATPLAAALAVAASIAVASETRTRQPWSRDFSFNR